MDDIAINDLNALPDDIPRTAREVAERCLILLAVVAAGHTIDRSRLTQWLRQEGVWHAASPKEVQFFESASPTKQQTIDATWRAEALFALLWALGRIERLPPLTELCDLDQLQDGMPNVFTPTSEFLETAALRTDEAIAEVYEETCQTHWTVRDAQIHNRPIPNGLNPGVVRERHYALNWLIGYWGQAWDDITTDT